LVQVELIAIEMMNLPRNKVALLLILLTHKFIHLSSF